MWSLMLEGEIVRTVKEQAGYKVLVKIKSDKKNQQGQWQVILTHAQGWQWWSKVVFETLNKLSVHRKMTSLL